MLLRYDWRNVEVSVSLLNLTNTVWREAQFAEATCLRSDEGTAACPTSGNVPSQNFTAAGIDGISFTPGSPFNVRGGLQIFF